MEPRLIEIRAFMEEDREDLSTVDDMIKTAHYKRAVSRSYYAILNSAKAVLLTLGLSFSSHSGVLSAFNEHLVKTGKVDKGLNKIFQAAFKDREEADY